MSALVAGTRAMRMVEMEKFILKNGMTGLLKGPGVV